MISGHHDLTAAQRRVVELLRIGMCNREIATNLGISEQTVRNHLHLVFARFRVRNRRQLIAYLNMNELAENVARSACA